MIRFRSFTLLIQNQQEAYAKHHNKASQESLSTVAYLDMGIEVCFWL